MAYGESKLDGPAYEYAPKNNQPTLLCGQTTTLYYFYYDLHNVTSSQTRDPSE